MNARRRPGQGGAIARVAMFAAISAAAAAAPSALAQQRALPPPAPAQAPCVEVRIGQDVAGRLDCLNRALREEVGRAAPVVNGDPAADLGPVQRGQPTPASLRQRYGNAYGRSLVPQRPARDFPTPFAPVR